MNKKLIAPTLAIIVVLVVVWLFDSPVWEYKKITGFTQGTTYNITYKYKANTNLKPDIEKLLGAFDASLSTYKDESVISKINRNEESVIVDTLFKYVYYTAREIYDETSGAFDITVGTLVNAWGFGPGDKMDIDSVLADSLLQFVGMDKVVLQNNKIIKNHPGITFDVNAIAQGYSADVVASFLESKKIKHYLVEIGGEICCKGLSPKERAWRVGVDKPIDGNMQPGKELQAILELKNKALATSGNYRKFFEKDGVKYTHSINPKTGYPVLNRLLSVTILADECIVADAYATAFMVMGLERSIAFLQLHDFLEAFLIYSDTQGNFKVYTTDGMEKYIME